MSNSYEVVWNATINALPKADRRDFKLIEICQLNRQDRVHGGYRILNVFVDSYSPVVGHPWTTSPPVPSEPITSESGVILLTESGLELGTEI